MLAIQKIKLDEVLGISALRSAAAGWEQASWAKKALIVAGLTAVAAGVGLAIGIGIPPHTVMEGLKGGYAACKMVGQVYQAGSSALSALQAPQAEEKPAASVLPFMTSLHAGKAPEIIATAAAAA